MRDAVQNIEMQLRENQGQKNRFENLCYDGDIIMERGKNGEYKRYKC
jgi:hypothetical protein